MVLVILLVHLAVRIIGPGSIDDRQALVIEKIVARLEVPRSSHPAERDKSRNNPRSDPAATW